MERRRPGFLLVLLLLLVIAGGTAAVHFGGRARAPRLGGPHRIERSPLSVVADRDRSFPGAPSVVPPDPAEVRHPSDLLVRVLRSESRAPLAGARVTLQDPVSSWSGTADAMGEVRFSGAEAGFGRVHVIADGFAERRQGVLVREGETTELELTLNESPLVEGRVVSSLDGSPVAGATIHATPNPGGEVGEGEPPSAATDGAGAFRLRAGATGQALTLAIRAKGFVPGRRYLPLPSKNEEMVRVEIALDPTAVLRGVVLDSSGRPRPDAVVLAYPAGTDFRLRDWGARKWTVANGGPLGASAGSDGRYALDGLARGGLYLVAAAFPGFAPSEEREIWFPPAEMEMRADFTLRPCGGIFVKWPVGTRNNEGVGTATLMESGTRVVVAKGGDQGSARFAEIAPGSYEVLVDAPNANRRGSASVEVKAGETTVVEIVFSGPMEGDDGVEASIEGQVTDADGTPVHGARVSAVVPGREGARPLSTPRAMGVQVPGRGVLLAFSTDGTGEDGCFRIEGLKAGADYRILATRQGRISFPDDPVRAPASGIAIVLASMGRLKGRLVLPEASEAPAAMDLRVAGPGAKEEFRSIASIPFGDGSFDTGDLVPGPSRICAVAGEFLLVPREAGVKAGLTLDLGDLVLARGVMIRGRVVDSVGSPVPEVVVGVEGPMGFHDHSAEDGCFEIGPVPEGPAHLFLALPGEAPLRVAVVAVPGGLVGDLVLPRNGTLSVRATQSGARPWAGEIEVRGAAADSNFLVLGRIDHLGRFTMSLPAREYRIVIRDPADRTRLIAETPASVAEGQETKVDLRVRR